MSNRKGGSRHSYRLRLVLPRIIAFAIKKGIKIDQAKNM